MVVRPVTRAPSLVERAAAELGRLVSAGEWAIGARLPGEVELGSMLGVGRSTVREAVRSLISDGLLESRQGAGTFVVSATAVTEWDRRLRRAAIADVYEVRVALELEAGRLAAARRTAADLVAMDAALDARGRATEPTTFVDADLALHRAVIDAAHNPVLTEIFAAFLGRLRSALLDLAGDDLRTPADRAEATDAHRDLVEAIRDGDAGAAVAATRANVETTLAQLRSAHP